jgi:hypothetical protein
MHIKLPVPHSAKTARKRLEACLDAYPPVDVVFVPEAKACKPLLAVTQREEFSLAAMPVYPVLFQPSRSDVPGVTGQARWWTQAGDQLAEVVVPEGILASDISVDETRYYPLSQLGSGFAHRLKLKTAPQSSTVTEILAPELAAMRGQWDAFIQTVHAGQRAWCLCLHSFVRINGQVPTFDEVQDPGHPTNSRYVALRYLSESAVREALALMKQWHDLEAAQLPGLKAHVVKTLDDAKDVVTEILQPFRAPREGEEQAWQTRNPLVQEVLCEAVEQAMHRKVPTWVRLTNLLQSTGTFHIDLSAGEAGGLRWNIRRNDPALPLLTLTALNPEYL